MVSLDIFYSFRSPYSYLAIDQLCDIARDYEVSVALRPVRPLALREPDFFERGRPQFLSYLFQDVPREAERLGIAFGLPQPDPVDMDMASGKVAPAQPLMDLLFGLAFASIDAGLGLEFAKVIGRAVWGGTPQWNTPENLKEILSSAGLEFEALSAWAKAHQGEIEPALLENEAAQMHHHWGVPLMVLGDEPFFGQDRLDSLVWRLDQQGLRRS